MNNPTSQIAKAIQLSQLLRQDSIEAGNCKPTSQCLVEACTNCRIDPALSVLLELCLVTNLRGTMDWADANSEASQ